MQLLCLYVPTQVFCKTLKCLEPYRPYHKGIALNYIIVFIAKKPKDE